MEILDKDIFDDPEVESREEFFSGTSCLTGSTGTTTYSFFGMFADVEGDCD